MEFIYKVQVDGKDVYAQVGEGDKGAPSEVLTAFRHVSKALALLPVNAVLKVTADDSALITEHTYGDIYPALSSMEVIAKYDDAVYLRLPFEYQQKIECGCPSCKKNGGIGFWDTLLVPIRTGHSSSHSDNHTCRVHMPNPKESQAYFDKQPRTNPLVKWCEELLADSTVELTEAARCELKGLLKR